MLSQWKRTLLSLLDGHVIDLERRCRREIGSRELALGGVREYTVVLAVDYDMQTYAGTGL